MPTLEKKEKQILAISFYKTVANPKTIQKKKRKEDQYPS